MKRLTIIYGGKVEYDGQVLSMFADETTHFDGTEPRCQLTLTAKSDSPNRPTLRRWLK